MSRIEYREDKASRRAAKKRYYHFLWSLKKDRLLCRDKDKKTKYTLRINALKDSFNKSDYPASFDGRLAVYTVLFGDYDSIKPVHDKSGKCDYYIVTDREVDKNSGWKKIEAILPEDLKNADDPLKNRYFKMHPEVLFGDYEYSLYLDASMEPQCDLYPLLGRMGEKFIGMFLHNRRDCIYDEAKTVIKAKKATKEEVDTLINRYKKERFPKKFGLTEGAIILRKHNDERCRKLMTDWWSNLLSGPKRDQLGFMYCVWKNKLTKDDIAVLGVDYETEPRLSSKAHK